MNPTKMKAKAGAVHFPTAASEWHTFYSATKLLLHFLTGQKPQSALIYGIDVGTKRFQIVVIMGSHQYGPPLCLEDPDNLLRVIVGLVVECVKGFI